MARFLGIDTSNYTTSVAVAEDGRIALSLKAPLKVAEGVTGLRQSDAVFAHTANLPELLDRLKAGDGVKGYSAVGVSARPRDAKGSYMPCFTVGVAAAKAFSAALDIPVYDFSHQAGHISAAVYSSARGDDTLLGRERFIAFHVSGGTTEMLLADGRDMSVELIGGTADLNAGQAVDRAGVMLGLRFPCGPMLERLAKEYLSSLEPRKKPHAKPKISVDGLRCNLSGLENIAMKMKSDGEPDGRIALYVIDFIADTLDRMTANAVERYPSLPLLYAGGVMSNGLIRGRLTQKYASQGVYFAEPEFSSDNAAGIALLAERKHEAGS